MLGTSLEVETLPHFRFITFPYDILERVHSLFDMKV
jgi:hypothetical protein